jgi:peptidyl-prolyl cis-trans isomerase A (cyclophilin A)
MRAAWALLLFGCLAAGQTVRIETALGAIDVALDSKRAPLTVANFLRYVDAGSYAQARFHRTVTLANQPDSPIKIEVIQGGPRPEAARPVLAAVPLERTSVTGLKHVDGAISMARAAPDTATSDFFICIGEQPELDFGGRRNPDGQGFAAFGRVVAGMDVVRKIHRQPAEGQRLQPPVVIHRIRRLE